MSETGTLTSTVLLAPLTGSVEKDFEMHPTLAAGNRPSSFQHPVRGRNCREEGVSGGTEVSPARPEQHSSVPDCGRGADRDGMFKMILRNMRAPCAERTRGRRTVLGAGNGARERANGAGAELVDRRYGFVGQTGQCKGEGGQTETAESDQRLPSRPDLQNPPGERTKYGIRGPFATPGFDSVNDGDHQHEHPPTHHSQPDQWEKDDKSRWKRIVLGRWLVKCSTNENSGKNCDHH